MKTKMLVLFTILKISASADNGTGYLAKWSSLDGRPLPQWYDAAKIGIFIHWGVYSVPAYKSEWFWKNWQEGDPKIQDFLETKGYSEMKYQDFAPMFTAELFQPDVWADLFVKSGAKYVVLTTKHHDGFTLFPSMRTNWNAFDVGPKMDIVRIVADAVRKVGLRFGTYYSLYEWFNKLYVDDVKHNTTNYVDTIVMPDIDLLVKNYEPSVFWSDGDWDSSDLYWRSEEIIAGLYNDNSVGEEIVVNDRWGTYRGRRFHCKHGDFFNCEDRYNPQRLQHHKWENAFTIDKKSWGFRSFIKVEDLMDFSELLNQTVSTVSCGGNVLINVGPTKEGVIPSAFVDRLVQLGQWLQVNGEAIYNTSPWMYQRDSYNRDVWYTCKLEQYNGYNPTEMPKTNEEVQVVYAICLKWPRKGKLLIQDISDYYIEMLDKQHKVLVELLNANADHEIFLNPEMSTDEINQTIIEISLPDLSSLSSAYGWVLKFYAVEIESISTT